MKLHIYSGVAENVEGISMNLQKQIKSLHRRFKKVEIKTQSLVSYKERLVILVALECTEEKNLIEATEPATNSSK